MVDVVAAMRRFGNGLLDGFNGRVVDGCSHAVVDEVVAAVAHGGLWGACIHLIALFQHIPFEANLFQNLGVYLLQRFGVDIVLFLLGRLSARIVFEEVRDGFAAEVVEACFFLVVYLGWGTASRTGARKRSDYGFLVFGRRWLLGCSGFGICRYRGRRLL